MPKGQVVPPALFQNLHKVDFSCRHFSLLRGYFSGSGTRCQHESYLTANGLFIVYVLLCLHLYNEIHIPKRNREASDRRKETDTGSENQCGNF